MPRVDFYVIKDQTPQFALRLACRIAEKGFQAGMRTHIRTNDTQDTDALDALLWTFRDRSFIPHEIYMESSPDCPVTLGPTPGPDNADMLINLSANEVLNMEQFQRIAEIIGNEPESVRAGRERYRFYREQGLDPQHYEVTS